jgi:uncharacterized membrane protein
VKLNDYKLVFAAVGLIGVLLIASPALASFTPTPSGEEFSELYLLGPNHMAQNYPSSIVADQNYSVYVGVNNHLGSSAYYSLTVKFKNQTDPLPNTTTATPSPQQPLYQNSFTILDGQNWETPIIFSVSNASISGNQSTINQLIINNIKFDVNKPATWNTNTTKFSYELIFELWLYNTLSNTIEYNNRYVNLQLNLTKTL